MISAARRRLDSAERIVSFSGAGLSAESGVPTFRDAQSGHWARHDPMTLASPAGFAADPQLVLDWYAMRRRGIAAAEPNAAHRALAARPDIRHVTQNVDDLLERAGATDVIHLHGEIGIDRCHAGCGFVERVDLAAPPEPRPCPACGAPVRPGVVWFGETLPDVAWQAAERACLACDVLLVIGTSASVHPAAGLIAIARRAGATIIVVNLEASGASALADLELNAPAGEVVPVLLGFNEARPPGPPGSG